MGAVTVLWYGRSSCPAWLTPCGLSCRENQGAEAALQGSDGYLSPVLPIVLMEHKCTSRLYNALSLLSFIGDIWLVSTLHQGKKDQETLSHFLAYILCAVYTLPGTLQV